MKHIEIQANGYTFDVAIVEDSYMGQVMLAMPLADLKKLLRKSAVDLDLNPDNCDEMNAGATQVFYTLV